jgi:hypothetical protein
LEKHFLTKPLGTPLFGLKMKPDGTPDEITIVRAGIFDDIEVLNQQKPAAELYTNGRVKWINPIEGTDQFIGMMPNLR